MIQLLAANARDKRLVGDELRYVGVDCSVLKPIPCKCSCRLHKIFCTAPAI